jgi:hypothetical protein
MGLIWEVLKSLAGDQDNKKSEKLEKEMNYYGLEEHEKEAVRRGDYEPYNFEDSEDEELDEDDYYYEDK